MYVQKFKLLARFYYYIAIYSVRQSVQAFYGRIHQHTYHLLPSSRRILVLGGSFGGSQVAQRLAHTLPSGYTVTLLEKNSHFHHAFAFPRFSVTGGRESRAFVPYDNLAAGSPKGIFQHIQGEAETVYVDEKRVDLIDGRSIQYEYLVVATGAIQPSPTKLRAVTREDGIKELQGFQQQIQRAKNIAVIGGGAVGVELAMEIKDTFHQKQVTLIHSRNQLLPRFGPKLHELALKELKNSGVDVILNERPSLPYCDIHEQESSTISEIILTLSDRSKRHFDLIIPCTGLRPNSSFLLPYANSCLASSGEVLVTSTLQIQDNISGSPFHDGKYFALGDVARTGAPKQGRSAFMQAEVVVENILQSIYKKPLQNYTPNPLFDETIQLTLGKEKLAMYVRLPDFEFLELMNKADEDVGAAQTWKRLNAKMESS